jgi:hypothetical protein
MSGEETSAQPGLARGLGIVRRSPLSAAFLLYSALAVALTYPLLGSLGTAFPLDANDPAFSTWVLWWDSQRVPFSGSWWNGPFFHPIPGSLALGEHLVGLSAITWPVLALGGSPVLAYNVAFLLSFPLCAFLAHLLCLHLTGRQDAALVGGLAFGFAPYRMGQLAHLQMLSVYWMPLGLLGLHLYMRSRRSRWLVLFASSWLLQALSNGYLLFYFSVLVVLWILWFADAAAAARIAAAWALAVLPLVPVLLRYQAVHSLYGLGREGWEVEAMSADVVSLLHGAPLLSGWAWTSYERWRNESWLFPGIAPVALVLSGLYGSLTARTQKPDPSRWRLGPAVLALAFAAAALSRAILGPWRIGAGALQVSLTAIEKPLSLAFVFLLATLALSPRLRDAYRRGSSFAFYVVAAGVTWLLSLGPNPRLLGMPIWQKAPYFFLMKLPGFSQLRVTARFSMIAALCLAVGASLALARLLGSLKHGRGLLVALAAVAVLRDGWITRLPLEPAPKRLKILESLPGKDKAVLELPLGGIEDAAAVFRSLYHRVSVVNGYSSYYPPHYAPLLLGLEEEEDDVLTELQSRDTVYVVIDRRRDSGGTLERYVSRHRGSRAIGVEDLAALYLLPETPRPALAPGGRALPIRGIEANAGPGATQMIDGDLGSQWTTGAPQQGHERILIDLGAAQRVGRLEMALGHVTDFPRELLIETSLFGATDWSEVFRGELAGKTLGACLDDPHHLVLRFDLGSRLARFIRLRQLGSDRSNAWSVAEIAVLEGSLLPH